MMSAEFNVSCRSCGNRTVLRRHVDTDAGCVTIDDCVMCDRARCPGCDELVPGTAKYCAGCGAHLLGVDEETARFLEISGMRRCGDCSTYVTDDRPCACRQTLPTSTAALDPLAGIYEMYSWIAEDAWWSCMRDDEDDQAA